jgi:hypothetical protein
MSYLPWAMALGVGATALVDLWALARRQLLGVPLPDYGLVGRWLAHLSRGRFSHRSIAGAAPIGGEQFIGWMAHYLTGVAFAQILLGVAGVRWLRCPTLAPAMTVGICTVAAPFLLMQPGMGAGIAASRTRRPNVARAHSLVTHAIFGFGLFLAGLLARRLIPS